MKILILPIIALLLTACGGPVFEKICEDNGVKRNCTPEELSMIDGMHKIIKQVYDFDASSIEQDFIKVQKGQEPSLLIFGENHIATIGKTQTLGAINHMAKKGAVLLLEGADRSRTFGFDHCGMYMVYSIYTFWQYQKSHAGYDPDEVVKYIEKKRFFDLYLSTRASYDLSGLTIDDLKCQFWDHGPSLKESINRTNIKRRNYSMVDSMSDNLNQGKQVIVNTGSLHTPLGDFLKRNHEVAKDYDEFEKEVDRYYAKSKIDRKIHRQTSRTDKDEYYYSSSKMIHEFLKGLPNHAQFIHKRMFTDPLADF